MNMPGQKKQNIRDIYYEANLHLGYLLGYLYIKSENLEKEMQKDYQGVKKYMENKFKKTLDYVKELYEKIVNDPYISPHEKSELQQKIENSKREFHQLQNRFKHFNENKNHQSPTSEIAFSSFADTSSSESSNSLNPDLKKNRDEFLRSHPRDSISSLNTLSSPQRSYSSETDLQLYLDKMYESSSLNDTLGPDEKALIEEFEFLDSREEFSLPYLNSPPNSKNFSIPDEIIDTFNKNSYVLSYVEKTQERFSGYTDEQASLSCGGDWSNVHEPLDLTTYNSSDRDALNLPQISSLSKKKNDNGNEKKRRAKRAKRL